MRVVLTDTCVGKQVASRNAVVFNMFLHIMISHSQVEGKKKSILSLSVLYQYWILAVFHIAPEQCGYCVYYAAWAHPYLHLHCLDYTMISVLTLQQRCCHEPWHHNNRFLFIFLTLAPRCLLGNTVLSVLHGNHVLFCCCWWHMLCFSSPPTALTPGSGKLLHSIYYSDMFTTTDMSL